MSLHWRTWGFVILLGSAAWGIAALSGKTNDGPALASKPVNVAKCYVRFIDRVTLSFQRAGSLEWLTVAEGDEAAQDALVARLDDDVPRKVLAIAEAEAESDIEIRVAAKASEAAATEHAAILRANAMTAGTYPETEVRRLQLVAEGAALQIKFKEHEHDVAQRKRDHADADVATYALRAPFSGAVTKVSKSVGEAVQPGEPILELINTRRVRVEGYVDLAHAWTIKPGNRVEAHVSLPDAALPVEGRKYAGTLRFVDVTVQTVRRVVRVWAEVDNVDGQLRDGLTADLTIFPDVPAR